MAILNLKQAAEYIGKSPSTLRRLMGAGKIGFYGLANEQKTFSVRGHLDVYLRSVETKPVATPQKKKALPQRKRATNLFDNLTV